MIFAIFLSVKIKAFGLFHSGRVQKEFLHFLSTEDRSMNSQEFFYDVREIIFVIFNAIYLDVCLHLK